MCCQWRVAGELDAFLHRLGQHPRPTCYDVSQLLLAIVSVVHVLLPSQPVSSLKFMFAVGGRCFTYHA